MSVRADEVLAAAPWRPSATILASTALHCAAGAAAVLVPGGLPWALGAVAGNHAFLTVLGMWPRSTWLGPNLTRLPVECAQRRQVAITFDDGPDPEITPRILDALDARGAHATFFCIGERAAANPAVVREIARRGHGVENHSMRHAYTFALHSLPGFRREISAAQSLLADITGRAPRFFRAPMGLRNPLLDPVLHELGLALVSWSRRAFDTREQDPEVVTRRLTGALAARDILVLHDGHAARDPQALPASVGALPRVLDVLEARGLKAVALHEAVTA